MRPGVPTGTPRSSSVCGQQPADGGQAGGRDGGDDDVDVADGVEAFVLVLPQDDPILICNAAVPLSSLGGRAWVSHGDSGVEARLLSEAVRAAGIDVDVVARTTQVDAAIIRLATSGIGFTVVPEGALDAAARPDARPLAPTLEREVTAAARTPAGVSETALVDALLATEWSATPPTPALA